MQSCEPPAALNVLPWPVAAPKNRVGGSAVFSFVFAFQYIGETLDTPAENGGCGYDFASGVHKYLYAQDDPVNGTDPSGHDDIGDVLAATDMSASLDAMPNVVSLKVFNAGIFGAYNGASVKVIGTCRQYNDDPTVGENIADGIEILLGAKVYNNLFAYDNTLPFGFRWVQFVKASYTAGSGDTANVWNLDLNLGATAPYYYDDTDEEKFQNLGHEFGYYSIFLDLPTDEGHKNANFDAVTYFVQAGYGGYFHCLIEADWGWQMIDNQVYIKTPKVKPAPLGLDSVTSCLHALINK